MFYKLKLERIKFYFLFFDRNVHIFFVKTKLKPKR